MRFYLFLLACFALIPQTVCAQHYRIVGALRDLITVNGVDSAIVELLREDSSLVDASMSEVPLTKEEISKGAFMTHKIAKDGAAFVLRAPAASRYIIRCSKTGYETIFRNVEIKAGMSKRPPVDLGDIYMQVKTHQLNEVGIKATKIKMFYKGDTLVYNANAFVLPDGSMLDDLVKQLAGAEIRDGNVYVNGRLVENLLLGGKDFFNGNPRAAFKNLPAYVVNRVKVYEKNGVLSETTGTDMGDKSYVMDVHLKRQYIGTLLGQLKAGYGTEDRYDGGLFVMRFDDRQSFTLTGDFNNLNTSNSYNEYGGFARNNKSGLHKRNYAAADYRFEPSGKLKLTANAAFEHRGDKQTRGTTSETFLSGGNTYGCSLTNSSGRSAEGSGNVGLTLRPRRGRLYEMKYSGSYSHQDNNRFLRAASFDALPVSKSVESILDSVLMQPMSETLRKQTLNRLSNDAMAEGNRISHKLTVRSALAYGGNLLDLNGEFAYKKNEQDRFDIYHLNYPKTEQPADYRRRFNDVHTHGYDYRLRGRFLWKYLNTERANGQLTPGYAYFRKYDSDRNPLYRLDWLGGEWVNGDSIRLGMLPSVHDELLRCLDIDNSYFSNRHTSRHTLSLDWRYDTKLPTMGWLEMKSAMVLHYEGADMHYRRFGELYPVSRHAWLAEPSASIRWRPVEGDKEGTKLSVMLKYNGTHSQPSFLYLLDMTDESNPLFVNLGNPGLKNMRSDKLTLQLDRTFKQWSSFNTSVSYIGWHNQVAAKQMYDSQTGVQTTQWVNVNDNWSANYALGLSMPLNKKGSLTMQAKLDVDYFHSADLSFEQQEERTSASHVGTLSTRPAVTFSYYPVAGALITGGVEVDLRNVDGERDDFVNIHTTNMAYHLGTQFPLPGDISLATDLCLTSRYGYNDDALNDTRLLWNISLSRTFRSITLMLKGSDLLGRDRYTDAAVNAQGRTEIFSNALPRYVLLSVTWKFNKVGKKML